MATWRVLIEVTERFEIEVEDAATAEQAGDEAIETLCMSNSAEHGQWHVGETDHRVVSADRS